jgi:hypothetical protein
MSVEAISAAFAALSFLVAAWALRWQTSDQKHRYLLDQATHSLERAYDALTEGRSGDGPPVANRLNWLTCARHLERYRVMKADLKHPLYRLLCEENEEHWRYQFYLCVNRHAIHRADYYAESGQEGRAGIEPTSAFLVHSFATWPEGRSDPIREVDLVCRQDEADPLSANIGLRFYLESFAYTRHLTERGRQRSRQPLESEPRVTLSSWERIVNWGRNYRASRRRVD